jgi:TolA-binding protein
MKKTAVAVIAAVAMFTSVQPAHAVSKEIIQLQTEVQTLQDMLQHLQQTNDERMGVLQHLIEQTADNVNRMSSTVASLDQAMKTQNDASTGKIDGVSGQVQSLNDSVDELKTRVANLNKTLQDLQTQLQTMQSGQPQQGAPGGAVQQQPMPGQGPAASNGPPAPPVNDLYQSALRDYNSARYDVASSEFADVLKFYPQDDLAGNAQF